MGRGGEGVSSDLLLERRGHFFGRGRVVGGIGKQGKVAGGYFGPKRGEIEGISAILSMKKRGGVRTRKKKSFTKTPLGAGKKRGSREKEIRALLRGAKANLPKTGVVVGKRGESSSLWGGGVLHSMENILGPNQKYPLTGEKLRYKKGHLYYLFRRLAVKEGQILLGELILAIREIPPKPERGKFFFNAEEAFTLFWKGWIRLLALLGVDP